MKILNFKKLFFVPILALFAVSMVLLNSSIASALIDPTFVGFNGATMNVSPTTLTSGYINVTGWADENAQVEVGILDSSYKQITPTYLAKGNWGGETEYLAQIDVPKTTKPGVYYVRAVATGACDYSKYYTTRLWSDVKCDEDSQISGITISSGVWVNHLYTTGTTPTVTGTVNTSGAKVQIMIHGKVFDATTTGNNWSATISSPLTIGTHIVTAVTNNASDQGNIVITDSIVTDAKPTSTTDPLCDSGALAGKTCTAKITFAGTGAEAGDVLSITSYRININTDRTRTLTPNDIQNGFTFSYTYTSDANSCLHVKRCKLGIFYSVYDAKNGIKLSSIDGSFEPIISGEVTGGSSTSNNTSSPNAIPEGSATNNANPADTTEEILGASTSKSDKKDSSATPKTIFAKATDASLNWIYGLWIILGVLTIILADWFIRKRYAQTK